MVNIYFQLLSISLYIIWKGIRINLEQENIEIDNTITSSSSSETNSANRNSDTINDWTVEKVTLYFHLQTSFIDCLSNNQEDYDVQEIPSILHASIRTILIPNNDVAATPKTTTSSLCSYGGWVQQKNMSNASIES